MRSLSLVLLLAGPVASAAAQSNPPAIEVTGEATRSIAPDRAEIDFGVVTQAQTAREAAEINAGKVDAVTEALRALLDADAELETTRYVIRPNYQRSRDGESSITSYTASNTIRVSKIDVSLPGRLIDAATTAGANSVDRLHFTVEDEETEKLFALGDAARQARRKAGALAEALGLSIIGVASVNEGMPSVVRPYAAAAMRQAEAAPTTPIEPGDVQIRASVTLRVLVRPR